MARLRRPLAEPNALNPSDDALLRGAAPFHGGTPHRERGVILSVDAARHSYRVLTSSGRTLPAVGRLMQDPGDLRLLSPQTPVRIDYSLGEPYIDGVLPAEVPTQAAGPALTGAEGYGAEDRAMNQNLGANFRGPGVPGDLMPGDQVLRSPDGAAVSALHGKVAQLQGSPLARVSAFGITDTVELIAGLMRVVTWMGEARILNEDGRVSYVWRGGSDQVTETGADEEQYTLRLDLGARGDLATFAVTTPQGQPLFRAHVSREGHLSVLSQQGIDVTAGSGPGTSVVQQTHGDRRVVTEGNVSERTAGDTERTYEGAVTDSVSGNHSVAVLGDLVHRVNRHRSDRVSQNDQQDVGGTRTTRILRDDNRAVTGRTTDTLTGPWSVAAAAPISMQSPRIELAGSEVRIGTEPLSHAVLYEQLEAALQRLNADITEMKLALRLHTHGIVLGVVQPSTELTLSRTLDPFILQLISAKSTSITLGP